MPTEPSSGKKPTSRRYSPEEKAAAVRMVRALRTELGTEQGTVSRVASSATAWSRCAPGCDRPTSTTGSARSAHRGVGSDQGTRTGEPRTQARQCYLGADRLFGVA